MQPLHDDLVHRPVRAARLRAAGLSRRDVDGPMWSAPYHGVRDWAPADHPGTDQPPLARIRRTVPLLPPEGALGGWAAAHLQGVTTLDGQAPDGTRLPVDHVVALGTRLQPKPGIRLRRQDLAPAEVVEIGGVPVTCPLRTAFDLARWAKTTIEAVVAVDALIRRSRMSGEFSAYVWSHPRMWGIGRAREASLLASPGVDSPWETRMRMVWVMDARLPPPLVNPAVFDRDGQLLGYPDLLDAQAGLAIEYDGAHHRQLDQHTADNLREERFERAGIRVIRCSVLDLRNRTATVRRFQREYASQLARDRSRETWTLQPPPWWQG